MFHQPQIPQNMSLTPTIAINQSDVDIFAQPIRSCGEIHVIVGPMFAGKTTALLRRIKSEGVNGR